MVVDRHKLTVFYHKSLDMDAHSIGEEKLRTVFVFVLAHLEGRIQPSLAINANSPNKETNKHLDYNALKVHLKSWCQEIDLILDFSDIF